MGLFGKRTRLRPGDPSTWQMGQDGIVQGDTTVTKEDVPGYWQGGDKFGGRDALSAALAAISDAFAQRGGSQNGSVGMLMGSRNDAMQMAREAQAAQQARMQGREDFSWELGEKAKYEKPPSRNFEDNAGNQWTIGPNGPELVYADPIPKMYIQGDQAVQISNPFAQPRQAQPQQDYGADLPEGYSIRGGATPPASPPFQAPFRGGIPRRRR